MIEPLLSDRFVALIPKIENFAGARSRHLNPEAREEVVQDTLALCRSRFLDLASSGKHEDEDVVSSMIYFSITHTLAGRLAHGRGGAKGKCVLDYSRRGKGGVKLDPAASLHLHVSLESPVPDQAALRVDHPRWLESLGERNRAIALDLAGGHTTGEVSRRHAVSPARVSQLRREFERSYREFHGAGC